jgi:hypothetical protein
MSITKEMVTEAEERMTNIQAEIFFKKLASLGVVPTTDEQASILWELGDSILQERPRLSDAGRVTKQAGMETFGNRCSALGHDGCSLDAHAIAENLCRDENTVKAAHILLAINNA